MAESYDGFVSYSHIVDDVAAQRLQTALQRFAKPWWRRRAIRVFRDEASLAAGTRLWGSITEAIDAARWFILLLSPEAALSEWVGREISYWVANKDTSRIVPVVTRGEFGWDPEAGDVEGVSVPPVLRGVFAEEPRWVDLRFAQSDDQLDLKNPAFSAAVADVSSAIREVPKDELASEELRQHRRATQTAWTAGIALLVLAVTAVGFGFQSAHNARLADEKAAEAQANAELAQASAEAEATARRDADINAQLANEEADRANNASSQMLDFVRQLQATRLEASQVAINADSGGDPFQVVGVEPDSPRLDFLYDLCSDSRQPSLACYRDASFVDPEEALATTWWRAHAPFHIREGFVNVSDRPLAVDASSPYQFKVFVTRVAGPELDDGAFPIDQEFLYQTDYLIRTTSDRCGPGYRTQEVDLPCDQFAHEFPAGLPPGRYSFWVEWHAPCSAWVVAEICESADEVISLFASSVDIAVYHDTFTRDDDPFGLGNPAWPFDPWDYAEPFNPGGS